VKLTKRATQNLYYAKGLSMKFRFTIAFFILAILLSACSLSLAEDITPPPDYKTPTPAPTVGPIFPASPPDLAAGAMIYAQECAPCHGATGLADGPMAPQLPKPAPAFGKPEVARAAIPANWFTAVTEGKIDALMPPFASKLSEQERWNVVAYAMSLGASAAEIEQGKTIYAANCAQCHGVDGKTVAKSDFTNQAMMSKLTQKDIVQFTSQGIGDMPGLGTTLSDADMFAAAAYIRTFTFSAPQMPASAAPQPVSGTPAASPADAAAATPTQEAAAVSGVVKNGSGTALPAGLKAVLHVFTHDTTTKQFSEADTHETSVSADGTYSFANLSLPEGYAFYVAIDFAGTTYESEAAAIQAGQPLTFDLPVTIYDTTTETSALVIDQAHILFDYSKPDIVQVVEFYIISNPGNKAVVAAEKGGAVVKISLPKDYSNLQFDQGSLGGRFIQTVDGFADTSIVPPTDPASQTSYSLVFAFDLPAPKNSSLFGLFGSPKLAVAQTLPLNASAVSILVPEGAKAEGEGFTDGGLQTMGTNAKFHLYTAGSRKAGETINITVSGKSVSAVASAPATGNDSTQNIIIGVGAFGVALILVGAWLYWRDRRVVDEDKELDEDEAEADEDGDESDDTEEVMDAIIALDDQRKSGNITEEAYNERRAELKARLKGKL
jgi:mono/diheme cytochrome c family protein